MELFNVEIDVTLLDFQKAFTIQRRLRQAEIEEATIQEQLFEDYIN